MCALRSKAIIYNTFILISILQGLNYMYLLSIKNNNINNFDFSQLNASTTLTEFYTQNNEWNCTCLQKKQFDNFLNKTSSTSTCEGINWRACVLCSYPANFLDVSLHTLHIGNFSDCQQTIVTTTQATSKPEISITATTKRMLPTTSTILSSTTPPMSSATSTRSTMLMTSTTRISTTTRPAGLSTIGNSNPTANSRASNEIDYKILIAVGTSSVFIIIVIAAAWIYYKKR